MNLPAKKIFWIFFLLSFSFLIPNLMIPIINYGQLGKQTFVAAMIEGFFQSDTVGWLFPIRHFLEPAHNGPVPWAEEVPLYHYLVVWAMKSIAFAGITANVVILGKFLSMIAWGTLIYGFFRIGKNLNPNDGTLTPWIFALTGAIFPVFRLYAIEVMPDLWMTALCVWAIERALSEKPIASASMILLASLFKYYALFTGFGIALFYLYRSLEKREVRALGYAFAFALAILPCVLFIVYFIHAGIPNPITEYRASDGHGHLSSISGVFTLKKWFKVGLWLFVKNSTIIGSFFAAYGLVIGLTNQEKKIPKLLLFLLAGWTLFPILFIESFVVHDYYGLQGSIGTALFMAIALTHFSKNKLFLPAIMAFTALSLVHVRAMSKPNRDFDGIAADFRLIVSNLPEKPKWGFVISSIGKNMIPYLTGLDSWMAGFNEMDAPKTKERLIDPRVDLVIIHNFRDFKSDTLRVEKMILDTSLYEPLTTRIYENSELILFKRVSEKTRR